jgi:hypothetical protein
MAITSNETVQFNIDRIVDNQILVYDATVGAFVNESIGSLTANVQITGLGRNLGSSGVGIYNSNDGAYLQFYKIAAGANTTLNLADNVITIDSVVGTSDVDVQTANANTVAVYDSQGNIINGSDTIIIEDDSVIISGSVNNVVISNGTITATSIITDTVELASGVQFPQADGNANQILVTDGNGTLSWSDNIDISGKVDSTVFNAYQATAITTVSNHAPVLNNLYSLGNSTNKYSQVFSTYFRGTADLAVNSLNLGSQPAANYMLRSDTYDADQIQALIANVQVANTDGLLSSITVTDGSVSYTGATVDIRSADSNIIVSADPVTKRITLTANVDHYTFSRIAVNGNVNNYIVADKSNDVLNFKAGTGISLVADPSDDSVTISATGGGFGGASTISELSDVGSIAGIQDGQALLWSSANTQFEYGNVSAAAAATSLIVGTRTGSESISLIGGSTLTVIGRTSNVAVGLS